MAVKTPIPIRSSSTYIIVELFYFLQPLTICYYVLFINMSDSAGLRKFRGGYMHDTLKYLENFIGYMYELDIFVRYLNFLDIIDVPCLTKYLERSLDIFEKCSTLHFTHNFMISSENSKF